MRIASCLLLVLCGWAQADEIEDAASALAARIASHLSPQETARLSVRNISSLPAADAVRARAKLETALPKHRRTNRVISISLTFSENAAGYLWVAEIRKGEVEMVTVPNPALLAALPRQLLTRRLLWTQAQLILDVVQQADRTLVLGNGAVAIIQADRRSEVLFDIPPVRDPRGRLEVEGNTLAVYFPGATCKGTEEPLHLDCDGSSSEFRLNGKKVHFVPGRNTLAGIQPGDETASVCQGMRLAAIKENVIALLQNDSVRDQTELPGILTALWPAADGAVVVIRDPDAKEYRAYAISVDCGGY